MRLFFRAFPVLLIFASVLTARAQYSVEKLIFRGGEPYTDAELAAVAGLQTGQGMSQNSLGDAAQHLLDTGVFDDASVSLTGAGKARTVVFVLKTTPLEKLLPATFTNFPWFTAGELRAGIHAQVPLYRGAASDAGNLPELIATALQQMLAAKSVTATVTHTLVEPTNFFPRRHIAFRIETPAVRVGVISLTGGPAALMPDVQKLIARLNGAAYTEDVSAILLMPLKNAGYITARLDDVHIEPSPSARGVVVSYSARVTEGGVYKITSFTADAALPADAPHAGEVASAKALQLTQMKMVDALLAHGYLDAYVDPSPQLDEAAHTVAYSLHTVRGEVYHLKSVTPLNLSPAAQAEFDRGWLLKPGDVYNPIYVAKFIQNNTALRALAKYSASFQAVSDPQTHLTDLTIKFVPGPGQ